MGKLLYRLVQKKCPLFEFPSLLLPANIIMGWNQFCYCPLGSSIPIEPAPMVMGAPLGGPMTIGAGLVE